MKKVLILFVSFLLLTSCGGIKTSSTGLESESFLEFIGNPSDYSGGVDVLINDKISFKADVVKDKKGKMRGNVYAISTGTHTVQVSYKNNVIFKKQIFIMSQETKKIVLP